MPERPLDRVTRPASTFGQDWHQQYLSDDKNPNGYCGVGGTGVSLGDQSFGGSCPTGIAPTDG